MDSLLTNSRYIAILNGLVGDRLRENLSPYAIQMSLRVNSMDVDLESLSPLIAGKSVVILVHGLMADDRIWENLSDVISKDCVVLKIRYNTGLHISENGEHFASLLHTLNSLSNVKDIHLVGHSMGGLVIRSACHYGVAKEHNWISKVKKIFLIAVPNLGAGLEKLSHTTVIALKFINRWYLGSIGKLIDQRSQGIKDLRMGYITKEQWGSESNAGSQTVEPLEKVKYYIIAGSLAKNPQTLMGQFFGDGLVSASSAIGENLAKHTEVKIFPQTGHNEILKSKPVLEFLKTELTSGTH